MDGRTLAIGVLALACVTPQAVADECEAALAAAYEAARDTYRASQDTHEEAASDARVAEAVASTLEMMGRKPQRSSVTTVESAEAANEAMQAARTATASLKVARTVTSRAAIEQAVSATLQASIYAERALGIARENAPDEIGFVLAKADSTAKRASVAARIARNAAEVCLSSGG